MVLLSYIFRCFYLFIHDGIFTDEIAVVRNRLKNNTREGGNEVEGKCDVSCWSWVMGLRFITLCYFCTCVKYSIIKCLILNVLDKRDVEGWVRRAPLLPRQTSSASPSHPSPGRLCGTKPPFPKLEDIQDPPVQPHLRKISLTVEVRTQGSHKCSKASWAQFWEVYVGEKMENGGIRISATIVLKVGSLCQQQIWPGCHLGTC